MDDKILKLEIANYLAKLKKSYLSNPSYSEQDFKTDFSILNELAFQNILVSLFEIKPPSSKITSNEQLAQYLTTFSSQELNNISTSAIDEIFSGYLKASKFQDQYN